MSNVPLTPPPPPLPNPTSNITSKHERTDEKSKIGDDSFSYYEIQISTDDFRSRNCTLMGSVLQTGPNCGLAALSMVSTLTPRFLSISELFNKAKELGITKNGEMFSVKNMAELAQTVLSSYYKIEPMSGGLEKHQQLIIDNLSNGNLLLVPYDADKNNEPCCKKGHAAHWAVVCGLLEHQNGTVYVVGRQGKSKYPSVWPFLMLAKSNSNLIEVDPKRDDEKEYFIPAGGIIEGLANQFIILNRCLKVKSKSVK